MRLGLEKRAKREFGPENLFFLMLARFPEVVHMDRLETGLAVTRYRDHRKEQAERKTGKEVVAFPEEERRLQDDVRDAGPRDERLAFTLASEIGIRRGRVSPERSHVHDPAYPGAAGLGHDVRDSRDVDLGEALLALGRDGHRVDHR